MTQQSQTTNNAPAVNESQAPAVFTPNAQKRGLESPVEREDLIIPRAKLLQSKSPEVEDPAFQHLNLRPGMIINSLTKEILPEIFVPTIRFVNWIRFNPRNDQDENFDKAYDPGQMIYMTSDPHDERLEADGQWGPNGEKPKATKFINFLSYFPGVPMPVVISFAKTSFKTGKELTSLVRFMPGDVFSNQFRLKARMDKGDQGSYFVFVVEQLGKAPKEIYDVSEAMYTEMSVKVNDINVDDQAGAAEDHEKETQYKD